MINCDNGRTSGFQGEDVVKYDVVFSLQSITLVVPTLENFENNSKSYVTFFKVQDVAIQLPVF